MCYVLLLARTRRLQARPHVIDGLIAATALVHGVPVITADDDFDTIPGPEVVKI
jgi:predicted nucleic acid-binding protein